MRIKNKATWRIRGCLLVIILLLWVISEFVEDKEWKVLVLIIGVRLGIKGLFIKADQCK
jgi:hypothetical protein